MGEAREVPLELKEGDRLWKVWATERKHGFQAKILTSKRRDGTWEMVTITDGPSGKNVYSKVIHDEREILATVDGLAERIADLGFQFKLFDLSGILDVREQFKRVEDFGWDVWKESPKK